MIKEENFYKGDFEGDWVVNGVPGGTNTVNNREIKGSAIIEKDNFSRKNKVNEVATIVGGDITIDSCKDCKYTLVNPTSVVLYLCVNTDVAIITDDPSKKIDYEADCQNCTITYQDSSTWSAAAADHAAESAEPQEPLPPQQKEYSGKSQQPIIVVGDDMTVSEPGFYTNNEAGPDLPSGAQLAPMRVEGGIGNMHLMRDEDGQPVKRGENYVYIPD